ncbi:MAG: glycosyltransferase family A protein [Verrucomicrobia bacterium]|nr:glycosyltransferase family A protein [Verrucomicrobiota bacterium]
MAPRVSILIPAYNAGKWIVETIRSAAGQTWPNKEILIVDDGSTDDTLAIARQFSSPEIAIFSQPNQGASAARNALLAQCQGDYIQWLDADDLLAPDKIQKQMEALQNGESRRTLLSCAWGRFTKRPERARFTPTALWCDLESVEWMLRKMEQNIYMQTTAWLVSRELTEAAGPWDTRLWVDDDGEYFSRVLLASQRVHFVPEAKTYYRAAGMGSLSQIGLSRQKREAQLLSVELHIRHLRSMEDRERVRAACLIYLQTNLNYIHPDEPDLLLRAKDLAMSLGGQLAPPTLAWQSTLLKAALGANAAKNIRFQYQKWRGSLQSLITR